ncbi:hypothetical protein ACTFBT_00435 [Streptomyces microflavus]|uniref:hypothetical protein n=1 Tax=Streptomyces TaxID=1883 RepID=UPI0005168F54|nr:MULTISPECIES: hypothetical protein [Streptomyces]MDX2978302.1 hypothetical protein [Streptomyces sp. NRRL_B-2249]GGX68274.1 hypothetical protein GCM10010298_36560 [Streptomyces microflavus]
MATRVNGAWGADGAYLLDGNPPVNWNEEPGSGLEAHQLCVEISQSVQAQIRGYEREHLRDLARAWILTVGMAVEALPTSGYANTGDALDHRDQQRRIILTSVLRPAGPLAPVLTLSGLPHRPDHQDAAALDQASVGPGRPGSRNQR